MITRYMTIKDEVNGLSYEAEYEIEGDGSGPTYSPMYGADSGDGLVVIVLSVWHDEYGPVTVADDELENIAAFIAANHEFDYDESYLDV